MRAIFAPFNLANPITAWDTFFGSSPELVEEVLVSQIQRGIDARKMYDPAHYFVGKSGDQIDLNEVFTVRRNVAQFEQEKSPHYSLMNEVQVPSFLAIITHLAQDEIGNGSVTVVLPDAVFSKHNDIHSIVKSETIARQVDHQLEVSGAPLNFDQIAFRSVGELLLFDHFLNDLGQGLIGLDEEARGDSDEEAITVFVVTPSFDESELTSAEYEVRFGEHSIAVTGPNSIKTMNFADSSDTPDGAVILEHDSFTEVGKVVLKSGKELCPMSGLAKASEANEETQAQESEDIDGGTATQQTTELD